MNEQKRHTIQVTHTVTEVYEVTGASSATDANTRLGAHMALTAEDIDTTGDGIELVSTKKTIRHIGQATKVIDDDDPRTASAPPEAST